MPDNKKPLASEINSVESLTLVNTFSNKSFEVSNVLGDAAALARKRDAKAAHKAAHKAVYDEQKAFNDDINDLENRVYAQLANLYMTHDKETFDEIVKNLPDGLGFAPKYEVQVQLDDESLAMLNNFVSSESDPVKAAKDKAKFKAILEERVLLKYCLSDTGSRKYLSVNRRLIEVDAKADADKAYYVPDALFAPPVNVVETVLPTVSKKLASDELTRLADESFAQAVGDDADDS